MRSDCLFGNHLVFDRRYNRYHRRGLWKENLLKIDFPTKIRDYKISLKNSISRKILGRAVYLGVIRHLTVAIIAIIVADYGKKIC